MWVARKGLGPGLFVKNLQTGAVRSYAIPAPGQWAEDSRHVLFQLDNGNENTHVYQLDTFADGTNLKDLPPFAGSKSFIQSLVQNSSDLLIANNQCDAKVFDLYRYVHASGKLTLLAENPGSVARWLTDTAGHVLGHARKDADQWIYETPSDASNTQWHAVFRVNGADTVRPLEVSADKKFLWALSNRGRDKLALVKVNLGNGAELDIDSISRDEDLIVASVKRETGGKTVLYTVSQDKTLVLGEHTRSRIHALGDLPQQKPLQFQSRDGLGRHGYLT